MGVNPIGYSVKFGRGGGGVWIQSTSTCGQIIVMFVRIQKKLK